MTGFATRSVRDILQYLYRTYRLVTPTQLTANDERFRSPYDGSTDFEAYFNGIDNCLFMAYKDNQPYSEGQTLTRRVQRHHTIPAFPPRHVRMA